MKMKKILAGIDLGPDTEKILAYAALFAGGRNASLTFLYVMDYLITPPEYLAPYFEEEKKVAEEQLRGWKQRLEEVSLKSTAEFVSGRLHEVFLSAVERLDIDMLVLGFRQHALRRSSSEKLIKGLQMPMLVVRGEKTASATIGSVKIRKILCPVDMSENSQKALQAAKELQTAFSSTLDIVHILPTHIIEDRITLSEDKDRARKDIREQTNALFSKFLSDSDVRGTGLIIEGDPFRQIASFSADNAIDLIVTGARGLSFIQGMLIGSVTDALLKSSPCPVLVIH